VDSRPLKSACYLGGYNGSLKIVNHHLLADLLENIFDKLNVLRMYLVLILSLLAGENGVERDLIGLIHHRPMAADHLAHVKVDQAGNILQVLVRPGDKFIRRVWLCGIGPKDDDV
jgi:hypothetical protein